MSDNACSAARLAPWSSSAPAVSVRTRRQALAVEHPSSRAAALEDGAAPSNGLFAPMGSCHPASLSERRKISVTTPHTTGRRAARGPGASSRPAPAPQTGPRVPGQLGGCTRQAAARRPQPPPALLLPAPALRRRELRDVAHPRLEDGRDLRVRLPALGLVGKDGRLHEQAMRNEVQAARRSGLSSPPRRRVRRGEGDESDQGARRRDHGVSGRAMSECMDPRSALRGRPQLPRSREIGTRSSCGSVVTCSMMPETGCTRGGRHDRREDGCRVVRRA